MVWAWSRRIARGVRLARRYSVCPNPCKSNYRCKVLVVGGGAGGCSAAARLARQLRHNDIIVLEPSHVHYYQPLFTLIAAGIKKFSECHRPQRSVMPLNVRLVVDAAEEFDPCNNIVHTTRGDIICYEYMLVAVGLVNNYDLIPGLLEALCAPKSGVSTIFAPEYCCKSRGCVRQFRGGHALFTFPRSGSKCSGAAQKVMYLADDYWRKKDMRDLTNITYLTGGASIFGVEKYARALTRVAANRNIAVNCCMELLEVGCRNAYFQDSAGQVITLPYNLLHVTPPMSPPASLRRCSELVNATGYLDVDMYTLRSKRYHNVYGIGDCLGTPNSKTAAAVGRCAELVNATGYLDVDKYTLRSKRYHNVYGIGDCLGTPNSKTAAAVASQSAVVEKNLLSALSGAEPKERYNGYGACPLLTSYRTGILAEFLYDKKPHETFPFDQSKERRLFYLMKTHILPYIYWNKMLKGKWDGPGKMRKILNPRGK